MDNHRIKLPRVSVLLPFRISDNYLSEAIESILNQSFINFELLLLDDGSTVDTHDTINKFNDSRIRYFREESNRGIVFQLNKGLKLAKGEFVARMDADDISHPDRLEKQLCFLENPKNAKIDVLGTNAVKIGDEKGLLDFKNYHPKQISFLLNFYCPILHPTVMIRKSVFNNGLKYSEEFKYAEDFALWRMIDNGNNLAILPDYLLKYRIHKGQTNQDAQRLEIQTTSCLKVGNLKSIRYIDRFIFSPRLKRLFIDYWFGNQNDMRPNVLQRYYIRYMKFFLGIRSELLNKIIK